MRPSVPDRKQLLHSAGCDGPGLRPASSATRLRNESPSSARLALNRLARPRWLTHLFPDRSSVPDRKQLLHSAGCDGPGLRCASSATRLRNESPSSARLALNRLARPRWLTHLFPDRSLSRLLSLAVLLVSAATALADTEMVMLRDGVSGMAEVLSTTEDSVTVKFETKDGTAGETVFSASRLDEHSFYSLRSKYMEKTVPNHVKLAVFCAENGMFKRAKYQMDQARRLDPEIDDKLEARPDIMAGIAERLAEGVKRAYDKGDLQTAYEIAELITTRFSETPLAEKAYEALDRLEKEMADGEAAETAAREEAITAAADDATRAAAGARNNVLVAIEKRQAAGRGKNSKGLRTNNRSTAKRLFEGAAGDFQSALGATRAARKRAGDDAELIAMLDDVEGELKSEAVNAWINAGNIELWRDNFNGARKAGETARAIDPDSAAARSFLNKVDLARASSGNDWERGGRPTPRPPRRR